MAFFVPALCIGCLTCFLEADTSEAQSGSVIFVTQVMVSKLALPELVFYTT